MQVLILLLTLVHAEYYGKYGSQEDLYNFYKNTDNDDMPATTDVTLTDADGYTQTLRRLARVSADSLRKLDKQELDDFKEALTMLMQTTDGEEAFPTRTEFDVATRTANTHVLTPGPNAINGILRDILDKLETRTEAFGKTTNSKTLKATRAALNDSTASPTASPLASSLASSPASPTVSARASPHATPTASSLATPTRRVLASNTARRWIAVNANLQLQRTTNLFEATDSTAQVDATDETDTVLAQTTGTFEKTDPVTTEDVLNETLPETDTFSTDTAFDTITEFITDKDEATNVTLSEINTDALMTSNEDKLSDKTKDYANSSSALTSVNWRGNGFATTQGSNVATYLSYRRQGKTLKPKSVRTTQPTPPGTTSKTKFRVRKTRTKTKKRKTPKFTYSTTTTKSRRRKTKFRTTTTTTTTGFPLDVPRLIELITNLTMDYGPNITSIVNKTLQELPILTCPTVTTTEEPTTTALTTTPDPYGNLTGTIMAKCFVCGLETPAMPRHSRCADAFAGDFIPLVPVDATARKMLASYRKYCRWMNVPKYIINETDPRSMWGRWTGGCSVRWIDISGIYTQRTCRNRHRAVMGRHWVSKRMAKLEMALQRMDTGCIISPMASLVPLSRGVSLYARFHACVCTGSWCNRAPPSAQCMLLTVAASLMLVFIFRYVENAFYFLSFVNT